MRWVSAAAAALIVSIAGATPALAAPNLSATLAPAPTGQGWVEAAVGNSRQLLEGPLDTDQLASLDPGSESHVKAALQAYGFAGAYARTWVQQDSGRLLLELVKAFKTPHGASGWYSAAKQGAAASAAAGSLTTEQVPNSYGIEGQTSTGAYQSSVVFLKGNDVFHITIGDPLAPQSSKVVEQAMVAYSFAPEFSIRPPAPATPLSLATQLGTARGLAGFLVLVALPLIGLLGGGLLLWRRERLAAVAAAAAPTFGPTTLPEAPPGPPAAPPEPAGPAATEGPPPPASPSP